MPTAGTRTPQGEATRRRIVDGAAAEIRENGITEVTLDDVRARSRTSKSQLFHYFPGGKEELLLAVAQHEAELVLSDQQPWLRDLRDWPSWLRWRNAVVARYRELGESCPLSVITAQLGRTSPGTRAVLSSMVDRWCRELAVGIHRLQETGDVGAHVDPDRAAAALVAGIQGGVVLFWSTGTTEFLETALDTQLDLLRGSRAVIAGNVA